MSFFNTKRTLGKVEFKGFGGIDRRHVGIGRGDAKEIVNFRVLLDRSLKKRAGFKHLLDLPSNVRALMTGTSGGETMGYALAGNVLYKLDLINGVANAVGTVSTSEGRASIFYYAGHTYLIDGKEIYDIRPNGLTVASGYAPLFGKNWGSLYPGEINEPLNILTPHARISYIVSDPPNMYLSTYYNVASVEAVYVNGILKDPAGYSIDRDNVTVNVPGLKAGDKVLIYLTFDIEQDRSPLAKNTDAVVFGGISNSRVFMWGGADKSVMFSSSGISNADLRESEKVYEGSGGLYFPEGYDFLVGDGRFDIRAVSRHYDRLLIFTEGDTWMADSSSCGTDMFPVMRINSHRGCSSVGGVTRCGNDPICVSRDGILRFSANTDELDECNAYIISDAIAEMLSDEFFENALAFENRRFGELWFARREDQSGRVFVYNADIKEWYTYSGIQADDFFELDGSVGFVSGASLFVFDDSLGYDILSGGARRAISAKFKSYPMNFDIPERKKRLMGICVMAETCGENVEVAFESDNGIATIADICRESGEYAQVFTRRLCSDRFISTVMSISTDSEELQRIYGVTVTVKP